MIRDSHRYHFQLGPGWNPGTTTEQYYERCEQLPTAHQPYKIKIVGVTCDPAIAGTQAAQPGNACDRTRQHAAVCLHVAVARGYRRKIITGRGVPLRRQLRSHRLFALHFDEWVASGVAISR